MRVNHVISKDICEKKLNKLIEKLEDIEQRLEWTKAKQYKQLEDIYEKEGA